MLIQQSIAATPDDGYIADNGSFNSAGSTVTLGDIAGTGYSGFLRFDGVALDNAENIISAKLTVQAAVTRTTNDSKVLIKAVDEDDATAPTSFADFDGRSYTTASVAWTMPNMTVNAYYESPNFAVVVQEIVDRGGWSSGQAIVIALHNNSSDFNALRNLMSYDSPGDPVQLTIIHGDGGQLTKRSFPRGLTRGLTRGLK